MTARLRLPAVVLALFGLTACGAQHRLKYFGQVPDFELTSQTGEKVRLADLKGKVWVADTFFTTCTGPCPMMSSRLRSVAKEVSSLANVRFVSFTVDPAHDTAQALLEYSRHFPATPGRWYFLTGPQDVLNKVSKDGLHLSQVDGSLDHSTEFALVDADTLVRGYYLPFDREELKRLIEDVRSLAGSPAPVQAGEPSKPLSAAQYMRAEQIYWQVMARCCIRKPGALQVHREIERRVAGGQSDQAILAEFARGFGRQPIRFDQAQQPAEGRVWIIASAGSAILMAGCWFLTRRRRAAVSADGD
jgi:protein SCO1/2